MSRNYPNKSPTSMAPAQREPLPYRANGELNARKRLEALTQAIALVCRLDPKLRAIAVAMKADDKNAAEIAAAIGIPDR